MGQRQRIVFTFLAADDEARRLFALLKELDEETNVRKAPVIQAFRLYGLEGLSRAAVAKRCAVGEILSHESTAMVMNAA